MLILGLVLGAFFYGYLITPIIGGWLANRFGGKWVYALGMLLANIATVLTPIAARRSYHVLIFARVMVGLGQVLIFKYSVPVKNEMISDIPPTSSPSVCLIRGRLEDNFFKGGGGGLPLKRRQIF